MDRFFKSVILLALLILIGSVSFIGYRVFMGDQGMPLPPLTHRSVVEAMGELEKMGLKARVESERSTFPEGTVISQMPQPGVKVRSDAIVTLKVSGGTSRIQLPDLRGLVAEEAARQIQEAGFRLGDQLHVPSDKPAGTVIAQEPAAPGSVPLTQPISLMVSTGSGSGGTVAVPDMVQRDYDEAVNLLKQSGLKVNRQFEYAPQTPAGMVLSMSPRAGASVPKNALVTLTVATHKASEDPTQVAVSPVAGQADGAAPAPAAGTADQAAQPDGAAVPTIDVGASGQTSEPAVTEGGALVPAAPAPAPAPAATGKIAKIRYQVPPVNGMVVKVEMTDSTGTRQLLSRQAKGGELLRLDAPYQGTAVVTVYLGGEFVWQDRYE